MGQKLYSGQVGSALNVCFKSQKNPENKNKNYKIFLFYFLIFHFDFL